MSTVTRLVESTTLQLSAVHRTSILSSCCVSTTPHLLLCLSTVCSMRKGVVEKGVGEAITSSSQEKRLNQDAIMILTEKCLKTHIILS